MLCQSQAHPCHFIIHQAELRAAQSLAAATEARTRRAAASPSQVCVPCVTYIPPNRLANIVLLNLAV